MTIEELKEILELKNENLIKKALIEKGFFDAKNNKDAQDFSLVDLARAEDNEEIDWVDSGKFSFGATLIKNFNGYTFVWVEINKLHKNNYIPYHALIMAKKN